METIKLIFHVLVSLLFGLRPSQGVKLAVVGPPHSGKSVLVGLLRSMLPRDKFCIIEGAPDGEGITGWSAEASQELTKAIRRKGKFLPEHVAWAVESIRNSRMPITLVDLGGMLLDAAGKFSETGISLTPQNEAFMRECTHLLVIANPHYAETAKTWIRLGEALGLKVFANLESVLEGADDAIFASNSTLEARITKLDRERPPYDSPVARKLAEMLLKAVEGVKTPDGSEEADVNFPQLAEQLGLPMRGQSQDRDWVPGRVQLEVKGQAQRPVRLWGNTPTGWPYHMVACAHRLVAYWDPKLNGYITLPHLVPAGSGCSRLNWKVEVRENHVLVHYDIPNQIFPVEFLPEVVPPEVPQGLPVILSGKGPRWLAGSLLKAYYLAGAVAVAAFEPAETGRVQADGRKWAEHHPGMGSAVVVASRDEKIKLGAVIPFPLPGKE